MMQELKLNAYGKLNLGLKVTGKLDGGYHSLHSIMAPISLHDQVYIRKLDKNENEDVNGIFIKPSYPKFSSSYNSDSSKSDVTSSRLPSLHIDMKLSNQALTKALPEVTENNLIYKALQVLFYHGYPLQSDSLSLQNLQLHITVKKQIHIGGGLAGGSSNAAAALLGVNKLLGHKADLTDLLKAGSMVGADVPFCILTQALAHRELFPEAFFERALHLGLVTSKQLIDNKPSLFYDASGKGDILAPIEVGHQIYKYKLLLVSPLISIPTSEVYQCSSFNFNEDNKITELAEFLQSSKPLYSFDNDGILKINSPIQNLLVNDLEDFVFQNYPEIYKLKRFLSQYGLSLMSGSGSTVFSLVDENLLIHSLGINWYPQLEENIKKRWHNATVGLYSFI